MPDSKGCGRKKVAFQLLRDWAGNALAVCSAEYLCPDSGAAVSPTMTLANPEYQMLRSDALRLAAERDAVGACLAVYLLDDAGFGYQVQQFAPGRVWDFACAATGYPVAQVAALLEAGVHLDEAGAVNGIVCCYEPAPEELAVCLPAPGGEAYGTGDCFPDAFRAAQAAGGAPDGRISRALEGFRCGESLQTLQDVTGLNRWFLSELGRVAR